MTRLYVLTLTLLTFHSLLPTEPLQASSGSTVYTVYVSTGLGGEILKAEIVGSNVTLTSIYEDSGADIGDVVVGPDGNVYAADRANDAIIRVKLNPPDYDFDIIDTGMDSAPDGLSFLGYDLYFNTTNGVYRLQAIATLAIIPFMSPSIAPELVISRTYASPQGTAIALTGQLLFIDGSTVLSSEPVAANDPPYSSGTTSDLIDPCDGPVGIAVSAPDNRIFYSDGELQSIKACDGSNCSTFFDDFGTGDVPYHMEFDLAGNLFVVTSDASGASKIWVFDTTSSPTPLPGSFSLPGVTYAIGLGLPPTSRKDKFTFSDAERSHIFNCGSSKLEIRMEANCKLKIECQEVLPGATNPKFSDEAAGGICTQYDWNGGFCVQYVGSGTCAGQEASDFFVAYLKFNDPPNRFPGVAHSDANPSSPNEPPSSNFDETLDNPTYYGVAATLPDDAGRGGGGARFSTLISVDLELDEAAQGGSLTYQGLLKKNKPPKKKAGSTIPIQIELEDEDGDAINGAEVYVAISRIAPQFLRIEPIASAGSSNDGNLMRPNGPGGYIFNLKTTGYPKGTYQISLSSKSMPGGVSEARTFIIN